MEKFTPFCPSRAFFKMLLWLVLLFVLILAVVSYLFGQYLGPSVGLWGGIILGALLIAAVLLSFAAAHLIVRATDHYLTKKRSGGPNA